MNRLLLALTLCALGIAGGLSLLASQAPDGLEHSLEALGAEPGQPVIASPMADYQVGFLANPVARKVVAGVSGTLAVLGLAMGVGWGLRRAGRRDRPGKEE